MRLEARNQESTRAYQVPNRSYPKHYILGGQAVSCSGNEFGGGARECSDPQSFHDTRSSLVNVPPGPPLPPLHICRRACPPYHHQQPLAHEASKMRTLNTPRASAEEPERADDGEDDRAKDDPLGLGREPTRLEDVVVEHDADHEHREPQCRELCR